MSVLPLPQRALREFQCGVDGRVTISHMATIHSQSGSEYRFFENDGCQLNYSSDIWGWTISRPPEANWVMEVTGEHPEKAHILCIREQNYNDSYQQYIKAEGLSQFGPLNIVPIPSSSTNHNLVDVYLANDQQITLVNKRAELDVVKKDWGWYATPSIGNRLKRFGMSVWTITKNNELHGIACVINECENLFQKQVIESDTTVEPIKIVCE